MTELDTIDRAIINALQGDFPLCPAPFAAAAAPLGLSEGELLERLRALRDAGTLSRFGPLYQIERLGGAFCLAAMAVPEADFERVAGIVNGFAEVAHNYRREHRLNMWFVLATETPAEIAATCAAIEAASGLPVLPFPKDREYFVDLSLQA
ncbi:Lrp/AsnC family transcriptional regulator [Azonexus sp.]|uniref:Lrp/AsnC family transcriptional regulator n=1 Tax=Azonexus sp. TaxID=1872668 RepID=UPI0035B1B7CE